MYCSCVYIYIYIICMCYMCMYVYMYACIRISGEGPSLLRVDDSVGEEVALVPHEEPADVAHDVLHTGTLTRSSPTII